MLCWISGGFWFVVLSLIPRAHCLEDERDHRIYVYPLPACAFDHYDEADIDGNVGRFHPGRQPLLPIHHRISKGKYATSDPTNATLFYIPAPFFLWDSSWLNTPRGVSLPFPLFELRRVQRFDLDMGPLLVSKTNAVLGNASRTLMVRFRSSRPTLGFVILAAIGLAAAGKSYILGILNGCPVVSGCGFAHVAPCNASIADGTWHQIVATLENGESIIYLDGQEISKQSSMIFTISRGPIFLGGLREKDACGQAEYFLGEMREIQLYDVKFAASAIEYHFGFTIPVEKSVDGHCFQSVRGFVEKSPWFQRSRGWDHFVLFAGFDYPAAYNALLPPRDEDYVLETAWPAFANFTILHLGARTERCFVDFKDPIFWSKEIGLMAPDCVRRFFRTITIPPFLREERLDCKTLVDVHRSRPTRIAYRGLAYSAMIERAAIRNAATQPEIFVLQHTHQVRLEFSNWTHELVDGGKCTKTFAFEGLCPWKAVGRVLGGTFGGGYVTATKKRALELWATSDTCLVLPGDGGFELRLYSMINLGCIPVIVHASGSSLPKLPFMHGLPWHEFAIFWTLDASSEEALGLTALQLLNQLIHMDRKIIIEKRNALLRYAHHLSWAGVRRVGRCGIGGRCALDMLVQELAMRTHLPVDPTFMISKESYGWKVPETSMYASTQQDLTGNNCPPGYPYCRLHGADPREGDVCDAALEHLGWSCPLGCTRVDLEPTRCVETGTDTKPCRSSKCTLPIPILKIAYGEQGLYRQARLAILTFSSNELLSAFTRPNLERFCVEHSNRYDLIIEKDVLLDPRDWHPSWNKLALLKRAFLVGDYDALVWIDDDVLITRPERDPIYDAVVNKLLVLTAERLVLASQVVDGEMAEFDTSFFVLKKGRPTMKLIDHVFQIGRRNVVLDGVRRVPRKQGSYEKDAFRVYIEEHGRESFELLKHGELRSIVQPDGSFWYPTDFAARFHAPDVSTQLILMDNFTKQNARHLV